MNQSLTGAEETLQTRYIVQMSIKLSEHGLRCPLTVSLIAI
jgi:hypothetical protein